MTSDFTYRRRGLRHAALFLLLALPLFFVLACDQQIEEQSFDQVTPESFFQNEQQAVAALSGAYAQLRQIWLTSINAQAHASDHIMVPTRGPDWGDGGIWRDLTQHNFNPDTPQLNGTFNTSQVGIARANSVLTNLRQSDALSDAQRDRFGAELRFLRAYYYYWLMDNFGGVPIVVEEGSDSEFPTQPVDTDDPPARNTRAELFDFILQELTGCTSSDFSVSNCIDNPGDGTVIAGLQPKGSVPFGRATQGAGLALTARILLNAEIYTGTVSTGGVDTGTRLYEGAVAAADRVINSGRYQLEDFFKNFAADNNTSEEIILSATFSNDSGTANPKLQALLHHNHPVNNPPWNGFTTIADFYKSQNVEPGPDGEIGTEQDLHPDVRGKQFLVGKQFQEPAFGCSGDECFSDPESGRVFVRGDDVPPLDLKLEIPAIKLGEIEVPEDFPNSRVFLLEASGAKPLKFELDPNAAGNQYGNDYPLFRLAEMYLIKAEAYNEMGNLGQAITAFNQVHTRRGNDPLTTSEAGDQLRMHKWILQEKGHEFVLEGLRRPHLIRYEFAYGGEPQGFQFAQPDAEIYAPTFTGPWLFKKNASLATDEPGTSEPFRALFPIPSDQLSANPNLEQNPGY